MTSSIESYTTIVAWLWLAAVLLTAIPAQSQSAPQKTAPTVQEPPEEDISGDRPKEYTFNPLQAAKEIKIGNYYFKKGSYRAASGRFQEALKWDPNDSEAWLRLAETRSKMNNLKDARTAWNKYLELNPDGKEADSVRRKLKSKP